MSAVMLVEPSKPARSRAPRRSYRKRTYKRGGRYRRTYSLAEKQAYYAANPGALERRKARNNLRVDRIRAKQIAGM